MVWPAGLRLDGKRCPESIVIDAAGDLRMGGATRPRPRLSAARRLLLFIDVCCIRRVSSGAQRRRL